MSGDSQDCIPLSFAQYTDEEYDNELLALANLLYGEEAANMTDQLIINSLDDIMQQSQATEAEENQVCNLMYMKSSPLH